MTKVIDYDVLNTLLQGKYHRAANQFQFNNLIQCLTESYKKDGWVEVQMRSDNLRSGKQNNSLHAYFQDLADALNDAGILPTHFFKQGYKIIWTKDMIKENIWKPVQTALFEEQKTSKATKSQMIECYDVINVMIGEKWGIHVEWKSDK